MKQRWEERMQQTFAVYVAASVCPPLTEEEITHAIYRAIVKKESQHGMGSIEVEVEQTSGDEPNLP